MSEHRNGPPVLASWLLIRFLPLARRGDICGDLAEEFLERLDAYGRRAAKRWYWWQVAAFIFFLGRRLLHGSRPSRSAASSRSTEEGDKMTHRVFDALRTTLRLLRRSPGFSLAAVLTLGVGIGANTLLFSVVNTILMPTPTRIDWLCSVR